MTRRVVTRWKKSVRRRVAIGGAALTIGAVILFVAAVLPASAHSAQLSGRTVCANGDHVITWSIGNDWTQPLTITSATATKGGTSYGVSGYSSRVAPNVPTSATTTVPGPTTGSVTLTVTTRWDDGFTKTESTSVALIGPCMGSSSTTTMPPTTVPPTTVPPTTVPPTTVPPTTAPPTTAPPTTVPPTTVPPTTIGTEGSTLPPPTSTTVAQDTSTTIGSQGSTVPGPTTTTVMSQGSTVPPPTTAGPTPSTGSSNETTPVTASGGPSGPNASGGSSTNTGQLPFTGSSLFGPIVGAGSLVLGGIAVTLSSARKRRRGTV